MNPLSSKKRIHPKAFLNPLLPTKSNPNQNKNFPKKNKFPTENANLAII